MSCEELTTYSNVWIDDVLLQAEFGADVLLASAEPALPSMRNISVSVPGRHGAYDFGAYFEPREFTLSIALKRQSYAGLKQELRRLNRLFIDEYARPKTVKLRFGDEVDKFYYVRITSGIDVDRAAERGFIDVGLTAFDPYAYSTVFSDEVLWGSEVITFEWYYLLGMDGTGGGFKVTSPQSIPIYVDGESLRPVIEIDGSANGLTISANGKSFKLPNFSATKWVINGENYSVTRNGADDLSAMTGDFIELMHGDNSVSISGSDLNFNLTIKYRNKYI